MTGIVEDFAALRRAIALSARDHRQVQPCLGMVRLLEAAISERHYRAYRMLHAAVLSLVTRPHNAIYALERLDALEREITDASRAAPEVVVLRQVRHLTLMQGGRAA